MRGLLLAIAAFALAAIGQPAGAQAIQQSGAVTPFHLGAFLSNGVMADAGTVTSPYVSNLGLFNGAGCPFSISSQTGPGVSTTPYAEFAICQTATATTLNFLGANGQAAPSVFFNVGGVSYPFPGTGSGNMVGPAGATSGDYPVFNGASGFLLKDSGIGPNTAGLYPVPLSGCNSAAIATAEAAAAAAGGGTIQLPVGVCTITATVAVTTSNIGFTCAGFSGDQTHSISFTPTACTLKWSGSSGGTMMSFVAPTGSTADGFLAANFLNGVSFDGNSGLAANGLTLESLRGGDFRNLYFQNFNGGDAIYIGTVHATSTTFGEPCDTQYNTFNNIGINQFGGSSIALYLDSWLNSTLSNGGCNASLNTFSNLDIAHSTGKAVFLNGADNNTFTNTRAFQSGSGVYSLEFAIANVSALYYPSNSNTFIHFSSNGPIHADGQTAVPACLAYTNNPFETTSCTMGNKIYELDKLNATPDPTVEAGAQLIWYDTTGVTGNALGGPLALGDSYYSTLSTGAAIGSTTLSIFNGSSNHIRLLNGTDTWAFGINGATHNLRAIPITGSGVGLEIPEVLASAEIYPGTGGAGTQTAGGFLGNTGAPTTQGNNGDMWLRPDGTMAALTTLYHKESGSWVSLASGLDTFLTSVPAVLSTGSGGVGYATGAGGAVTQSTSRTTGVTLNTTTGAVTLFTAAGSASPATFTVTDSAVAAADTIVLNEKSGANLYEFFVTAVANGSFNVTFFTTGGTTSDAPVMNFTIIKGATS